MYFKDGISTAAKQTMTSIDLLSPEPEQIKKELDDDTPDAMKAYFANLVQTISGEMIVIADSPEKPSSQIPSPTQLWGARVDNEIAPTAPWTGSQADGNDNIAADLEALIDKDMDAKMEDAADSD